MKKVMFLFLSLTLVACASKAKFQRQEQARLRYRVAQNLLQKGDTTRAMSETLQAGKLDPKNPEVQNLLGLLYAERGLTEQGEKHFRKAIEIEPSYAEAQNHLCALLIQKTEYEVALQHCTKAVENITYLTPERAYHNMGVAYERMGNIQKAVESYQRGLAHNKNFVMSRKSLALIYLKQKKLKKAIRELNVARKACQASPKGSWGSECPESIYRLAMAYVQLKQRGDAVKAFEDCVESATDEETYGKKCRENLRTLR